MKIIIGLITFLFITLSSSRVVKYYSKWEIEFYSLFNGTFCQAVPIKSRIFIADANCINNALKLERQSDSLTYINYGHAHETYENVATIDTKNIFFNENLTTTYNESKRNVTIVITDQPVFSHNNRSLLTPFAQFLYDNDADFNEQSQLVNLSNTQDINITNCMVPTLSGIINYPIDSCLFHNNSFWCRYDPIRDSDWDNKRINFVFCSIKESDKDVLVGIIPESSQRQGMTYEPPLQRLLNRLSKSYRSEYCKTFIKYCTRWDYVKIEYVADLRDAIDAKFLSWLAENPK